MNYFKKNYFTLAFISISLAACQGLQETKVPQQAQAALAEAQKQPKAPAPVVPDSVTQDLLALATPMQQGQAIQPRFNVAAANVDVADFFYFFSRRYRLQRGYSSGCFGPDHAGFKTSDLKRSFCRD